jgi:hypothetical protein
MGPIRARSALRCTQVMAAGKDAGLVDVKIYKVSETLSGLKMVIPRARRADRPPKPVG